MLTPSGKFSAPTALLLVDLQVDFFPGGALAIHDAHLILPVIQQLITGPFDLIVACKDWHPQDHVSFAPNHPGKQVGDLIECMGITQVLWPIHCVQGTVGAEFVPGWDHSKVDHIVYKGTASDTDSYSAFYDNQKKRQTDLADYLHAKGIKNIVIAGIATDYCVKYTVIDGQQLGFSCFLVLDGCKGVEREKGDIQHALNEMTLVGATFTSAAECLNI